jgi:SAM-dependent methyltransferase
MTLREIKDRILAIPWVYDTLRPLAAGGIDFASLASFCAATPEDRIFDLGCGTGQILPHLEFQAYLGVDLDASALDRASRHAAPNIRFIEGDGWDRLYLELNPTLVLMVGVVHHLSDDAFRAIAGRLLASDSLKRVATVDVTFFPGQRINNLLSRMDRGRFVRESQAYESLFLASGFRVVRRAILPTKLRTVRYLGYHLEPELRPPSSAAGRQTG